MLPLRGRRRLGKAGSGFHVGKVFLATAGALATAVTLIGFGHSLGTTAAGQANDTLRAENTQLKNDIERVRQENEQIKQAASASPVTQTGIVQNVPEVPSTTAPTTSPPASPLADEAKIWEGTSHPFAQGKVTVSVIAIPFEGTPLRHRVIAMVTVIGEKQQQFEHADVGAAVKVDGFNIQITAVAYDGATFNVSRIGGG